MRVFWETIRGVVSISIGVILTQMYFHVGLFAR
jgi:hypothetical protein